MWEARFRVGPIKYVPKLDDTVLVGRKATLLSLWRQMVTNVEQDYASRHPSRVMCNPHERLGIAVNQVTNAAQRHLPRHPSPFVPFRRAYARHDLSICNGSEWSPEACYTTFCARGRSSETLFAAGENVNVSLVHEQREHLNAVIKNGSIPDMAAAHHALRAEFIDQLPPTTQSCPRLLPPKGERIEASAFVLRNAVYHGDVLRRAIYALPERSPGSTGGGRAQV